MFPFEEKFFRERGVNAVYVGHPMFDVPLQLEDVQLPEGQPKIALFPGSRKAEVAKHVVPMLEVAGEIRKQCPGAVFVAAAPSEERAAQMRGLLNGQPMEIRVGHAESIIAWADVVVAKSGTTVLQVARQAKPMVVVFLVPGWLWLGARQLLIIPHVAMANILAGRMIVPEIVPWNGAAAPVVEACLGILREDERRHLMVAELRKVVSQLLPRDGILAADRVAVEVGRFVK
jgi:lipid-A-disaccharide synthase